MARIVKDADIRKEEIIKAAEQLFFSKGYDKTSIADIIHTVGIAKGTFYHHFKSKEELLDALLDLKVEQVCLLLRQIVDDENLPPFAKVKKFFNSAVSWKTANKEFVKTFIKFYYKDENILIRHKMLNRSVDRTTPLLVAVFREGMEKGTFKIKDPQSTAELLFSTNLSLAERTAPLFLKMNDEAVFQRVLGLFLAYNRMLELLLGLEEGSFELINEEVLRQFIFDDDEASNKQGGEG